jgi:hypothetical protein
MLIRVDGRLQQQGVEGARQMQSGGTRHGTVNLLDLVWSFKCDWACLRIAIA